MRGKAAESERYLEEWTKSEPVPCGDDLCRRGPRRPPPGWRDAWDDARLRACVLAGGWEPVAEGAA